MDALGNGRKAQAPADWFRRRPTAGAIRASQMYLKAPGSSPEAQTFLRSFLVPTVNCFRIWGVLFSLLVARRKAHVASPYPAILRLFIKYAYGALNFCVIMCEGEHTVSER